MSGYYSPFTGEHIDTDNPASWMLQSGTVAPEYDKETQGCYWRGSEWEVVTSQASKDSVISAISRRIISVSKLKGYDNPETLQSYVTSTNPLWRAEANTFIAWRDSVWTYVYAQIALWESEDRTISAADELVGELDDIVWPTESDYIPALVKQSVLSSIVIDGEVAENIIAGSGVVGAWRQSTGIYWVFFANNEPDTGYLINAYDGGAVTVYALADEKSTTHCIIRVEDETGTLVDPDQINIEIKRAV
jgi:hypothetical protein